jgi:phosphatidate cytidylyltransferase
VSDWRDDELEEDWAQRPSGEGVRVHRPDPSPPRRPGGRFSLPGDDASWSAGDEPGEGETGGSSRLPHWTDPPTGEVPRALGGDNADDDFETWSSLTGPGRPRFRTDSSSDWNVGDFAEGELHDDSTMIGALAEDDEQAWGPPARGRQRRGRPQRGARRDETGGLEGPPTGERTQRFDQAADGDLSTRVVTGVIMAVIALGAFAAGRPVAVFLVMVVVGVCAFELLESFRRAGYHPATVMALLASVLIVPLAYNKGVEAYPLVSVLAITFTLLWYLFEVVRQRPSVNVGLTLLVFGYVGILGGFAGLLLQSDPGGTGLLGGVIICAVGADVVGYFAGRNFGTTPLLPRISPHKTVEGLVAGGVAAVILGAFVGGVLHPWADKGVGAGLALGLIVAVTAPLGDLVESMFKRDLAVKDLGGFLPGHGGFLDRFDALLFALPASYYLAYYLFTH